MRIRITPTGGLRGRTHRRTLPTASGERAAVIAWLAWTIGLSAFFVRVAAVDLANFRPVSNDDVWIMSASYKLATHGVFGSDLWAGFFNADRHYFIALPVHHLLQAVVFRLAGAGIAQARLVSLVGAVVLVWTVSWLAYRWYGLAAALLAGILLVFWRSNLTAAYPGLPLLAVARSGRYDVGAVAWVWLAIALLDRHLRQPGRATALSIGISSGLATLTQFFGAVALPLVGLAWVWHRGKRTLTDRTSYWFLAGLAIVVLPYILYAGLHMTDVAGQMTLKEDRASFNAADFYLANVGTEFRRFASLLGSSMPTLFGPEASDRPLSPWIAAIAVWPALLFVLVRVRRAGTIGDRLLLLGAVVPWGFLWLLDRTKAPLYAIVLLPALCLVLAAAWAGLLGWAWHGPRRMRLGLIVSTLTLGLLAALALDSKRAYGVDLRQAAEVHRYLDVGQTIDSSLPSGARLLAPERWWWALRDHPYLSINNVWAQWAIARQADGPLPEFADWVEQSQTDFIIVTDDNRRPYNPDLQRQYDDFLQTCSTLVADWTDQNYGQIQVYRVLKDSAGLLACRGE